MNTAPYKVSDYYVWTYVLSDIASGTTRCLFYKDGHQKEDLFTADVTPPFDSVKKDTGLFL
jgi:hypothetical protein